MLRADLKSHAKASISWARPHPAWVTLVYLLITGSINLVVPIDGQSVLEMASGNLDPYSFFGSNALTLMLLVIAFALVVSVVEAGYVKYCLQLSRNQPAGFGTLFDLIGRLPRFIGLNLLMVLIAVGVTLLCMIPVFILLPIIPALAGLLSLAAMVPGIYFALSYSQAMFFAVDDPEMGIVDCLRESRHIMQGRKGEFFILQLSFLPWILAIVFSFGIATLWVTPYINVTCANYFNLLVDYRPSNPPGPQSTDDNTPPDWYNR